jgi:ribosomal protein S1
MRPNKNCSELKLTLLKKRYIKTVNNNKTCVLQYDTETEHIHLQIKHAVSETEKTEYQNQNQYEDELTELLFSVTNRFSIRIRSSEKIYQGFRFSSFGKFMAIYSSKFLKFLTGPVETFTVPYTTFIQKFLSVKQMIVLEYGTSQSVPL